LEPLFDVTAQTPSQRPSTAIQAAAAATLSIFEGTRLAATLPLVRAAEIGRREPHEPLPYVRVEGPSGDRVIIADLKETNISRKHLLIEPQGERSFRVKNESTKNSIALAGGKRLAPGEEAILEPPITCEVGSKVVRIEMPPKEDLPLRSLAVPTLAPGQSSLAQNLVTLRGLSDAALGPAAGVKREEELLAWVQASMDVFQSAAASADFLPKAVQAAAQMVRLDTVAVLLRRGGEWLVEAICNRDGSPPAATWRASQSMLTRVIEERRTFYHAPAATQAASLIGVRAVVAAPILDRAGQVVGALYGEGRTTFGREAPLPLSDLEAKLFELLAYGVASGLARIEQERQLIAERVRFEQFFTPELARILQSRGDEMLAARDAEISVLFCDIKGFSRISAQSGAKLAIDWVREVLSELSDCVAETSGVLIDYGGDSLEAIWGAPLEMADHAAQACRAALRMRATLPGLNERWKERLGEATDISVGIHSGPAQVGNIGSRRKFKYGAFGPTVNLASRVQGATKHVGVPVLVTQATAQAAGGEFAVRRLGKVRTVNIAEPVELYELAAAPDARWDALRRGYEESLGYFEQARFVEAMGLLGKLVGEFPTDEPTRRLLARNVSCLSHPPDRFDPVWNLESK
jgi:adenylate cyclase